MYWHCKMQNVPAIIEQKIGGIIMQEMTHRHSYELDVFYNEHKDACTNCGKAFQNGMSAHLGYIEQTIPAVLCDDCAHLLTETVVRYYWMKAEYEKVLPESYLWRYMDLAKFISLISKKKLFFPSAESFEDIFEGAKGTVERKPQWDDFYLDFFRHAIQTVPGAKPEELTDDYIQTNSKRLLSELETSGEIGRKRTFISCWHCNQYESEAMWKLYSTNVKNAIAIQTTYQQLYEALGKNPGIKIGKVKYIDYSKRFSSINGAYWYKRKSFEYEQEVRAIIQGKDTSGGGIEKEIDLEKLISAIYISPYAPKWFGDVVIDIVEKYELHKPVYQSGMTKHPFY